MRHAYHTQIYISRWTNNNGISLHLFCLMLEVAQKAKIYYIKIEKCTNRVANGEKNSVFLPSDITFSPNSLSLSHSLVPSVSSVAFELIERRASEKERERGRAEHNMKSRWLGNEWMTTGKKRRTQLNTKKEPFRQVKIRSIFHLGFCSSGSHDYRCHFSCMPYESFKQGGRVAEIKWKKQRTYIENLWHFVGEHFFPFSPAFRLVLSFRSILLKA